MKKVLLISTGGTFNKVYNPLNGELEIDTKHTALEEISKKWMYNFEIINIIDKDSLDMNIDDRKKLLYTIQESSYDNIIIIHGTDTIDKSAEYIAKSNLSKSIVFTGAMVPYSIDPVEATANLASAYGYLNGINQYGVYITLNGVMGNFNNIKKDRIAGKFTYAT